MADSSKDSTATGTVPRESQSSINRKTTSPLLEPQQAISTCNTATMPTLGRFCSSPGVQQFRGMPRSTSRSCSRTPRIRPVCASSASAANQPQQQQQHRFQPKVIISGGSIAGLATAAALLQLGFEDVHVFEEGTELGGAGRCNFFLSLWPSAIRALRAITPPGLVDEVIRDSAEFKRMLLRLPAGDVIQETSAHDRERFGEPPAVMIQWMRLHELLAETVPKDRVYRGMRLASVQSTPEGTVDCVFVGPDGEQHVQGDVLLGCDGVHSVVGTEKIPATARFPAPPHVIRFLQLLLLS